MYLFRVSVALVAAIASLAVTSVASAAAQPIIQSVGVTLPTTADQAMPPSQKFVTLDIKFASMPAGCAGQSFRYANEDGNWKPEPVYIQRPYIHQSAGYGYKGVYVQYWGSCVEGAKPGPIGNIIYTRYMLKRPAATVPDPNTAGEPTITRVTVALPTKPNNGQHMPSEFLPRVNISATSVNGCQVGSFRYANEDGNWKPNVVSRTRPLIVPSPGYGYKGVYVQLVGTCNNGNTVPLGKIVYTRYTLRRLSDAPTSGPRIDKVVIGLPTTNDPAMMPSMRLPSVHIYATLPQGCTAPYFRYANEDGIWKADLVSRTRPLIHPTPGFGYKGVYVQLWGTCAEGQTTRALSNVVYTRYTLSRIA